MLALRSDSLRPVFFRDRQGSPLSKKGRRWEARNRLRNDEKALWTGDLGANGSSWKRQSISGLSLPALLPSTTAGRMQFDVR